MQINGKLNFNIREVKVENLVLFFYTLLTIIAGLAIFHGDTTLATENVQRVIAYVQLICSLLSFFLIFAFNMIELKWAIFIPIFYYLIYTFDNYSGAFLSIDTIARLFVFFLLRRETQARLFTWYRKFLIVMSGIGIVCFLIYVFHLPFPYRIVPYYTTNSISYIDYGVCYLDLGFSGVQLCGLFNEPGYFGTLLALILCADDLDLRKKGNAIMLIAGILTFSLAFFIIIFVYVMLKSYKNYKLFAFMFLLLCIYLFVLPNIKTNNEMINYVLSRIQFVDGTLVGDNRSSDSLDILLESVMHSSNALLGLGTGYVSKHMGGILSIKTYLVNYGILGSGVMFGYPLICALKENKRIITTFFFIMVFFLSIYQRPHIFSLPYLVILFGGIQYNNFERINRATEETL